MFVNYSIFTGPVIALAILAVVLLIISIIAVARSQRRKPAAGRETLIGRIGIVRTPLRPEGAVHVDGEIWQAIVDGPDLEAGTRIIVTNIEGLRLTVRRKED